jgi:TRAP-type C4-dicarboxylate transport system permease small subunit
LENGVGRKGLLDRMVAAADGAAAIFLAVITVLTFADVILRAISKTAQASWFPHELGQRMLDIVPGNVPDGFAFGKLALCIGLFWGLAGCCYRGEHIEVDVFWQMMPRWARRLTDYFAATVTAIFMFGLSYMTLLRVASVRASGEVTPDLLVPLWPFYGIAWLGVALGTLLLVVRFRQIARDHRAAAE